MLKTRAVVSSLLLGTLLLLLWIDFHFDFAYAYASFVMLVLVGAMASAEWNRMSSKGAGTYPRILIAAALLYPLAEFVRIRAGLAPGPGDIIFVSVFLSVLLARAVLLGDVERGADRIARTLLGFMLIYMFYRLVPLLLDHDAGGGIFPAYCLVITSKSSDIGAFLFGYTFGKKKLIPKVSPGKTWAGAYGGVATPAAVGPLAFSLMELGPWYYGVLFGAVIGVVTILSDLSESLIKRSAGVKDSAELLPQLGGVFDLIDSLILAAPAGYLMFLFM